MCHSLAAIFFSDCTYIRTDETASVDGFDSFKNWFQFQQNKRENQFQFLKSFTQQMDSFENEVRTETGFDMTKTLTITAYLLYGNRFRCPKLSVPMERFCYVKTGFGSDLVLETVHLLSETF